LAMGMGRQRAHDYHRFERPGPTDYDYHAPMHGGGPPPHYSPTHVGAMHHQVLPRQTQRPHYDAYGHHLLHSAVGNGMRPPLPRGPPPPPPPPVPPPRPPPAPPRHLPATVSVVSA
jgi:hypothetical protein